MKKLLSILVAVIMAAGFATALAEAAESEPMNTNFQWSEIEKVAQLKNYAGDFYTYEAFGFKIWVPEGLKQAALNDDQKNEGWIDAYINEDESRSIVVQLSDLGEGQSLESLKDELKDQADNAALVTINGYNGLLTTRDNGVRSTVIVPVNDGKFMQFTFNGIDNPEFSELAIISIGSIQPIGE